MLEISPLTINQTKEIKCRDVWIEKNKFVLHPQGLILGPIVKLCLLDAFFNRCCPLLTSMVDECCIIKYSVLVRIKAVIFKVQAPYLGSLSTVMIHTFC